MNITLNKFSDNNNSNNQHFVDYFKTDENKHDEIKLIYKQLD